jgi:hypothetical protein
MPADTILAFSPGCTVELLVADNGDFTGLGQVRIAGVPLRSKTRPIQFRLDTPDGILYPRLELARVERETDGTARVRLRAHGIRWSRGEYADDYDQATVWLTDSASPVTDDVTLIFKPAELTLGGRAWQGFSYAIAFQSTAREIHRVLVHGTWEIGGRITGNTVLSQGQCNMPVYAGAQERVFTTACLKTLDQYGSPQGNSFQLGPRGGLIQGFDFQYATEGALLQFWPDLDSISSLLESPAGSDLLHVVDEYRFPLTTAVTTREKLVLFAPGALAEHETHDLWWEARAFVYGLSCRKFCIAPTVPVPEVGLKYQTRLVDGRLRMSVGGEEVDSTEVPYAIAERVLPVLAAQGIRRFFPEVMSESDVTTLGMKRKLEDGVHGGIVCASVCATHRFFPSEFWGGIKAWKAMADKAHALGMEIGAWFAPHFSPRAPIFAEHPEYRVISSTGLPAGGGYGFHILVVADWNTDIADWVLADLKRWKEEGGLDYLFTDSLSNMGLVQANYSERMRTNFAALGRLFGRIQALGIRSLSCECISPWMASRFGMADLRGDLREQNHAVAGQNDFGWWVDHLETSAGLNLLVGARRRTPAELERLLFRALAAGGYLCYEHEYGLDHKLFPWWSRLNHIFNQAQPHMQQRRVLPDRAGITWLADETRILWTFKDVNVDVAPRASLEVLEEHGARIIGGPGPVTLPAWGVYRIRGERQTATS